MELRGQTSLQVAIGPASRFAPTLSGKTLRRRVDARVAAGGVRCTALLLSNQSLRYSGPHGRTGARITPKIAACGVVNGFVTPRSAPLTAAEIKPLTDQVVTVNDNHLGHDRRGPLPARAVIRGVRGGVRGGSPPA